MEHAILVDITISVEHVFSWNSHMIEKGIPIVFGGIAKLGTDITSCYSWPHFPVVRVAQRYQEWLYAVVVAVDDESCKDDSMAGHST